MIAAVNPVGWFEIYVQEMERAKAFYESVLEATLEPMCSPAIPDMEMCSFPHQPGIWGSGGALVKLKGVPSGGNSKWCPSWVLANGALHG